MRSCTGLFGLANTKQTLKKPISGVSGKFTFTSLGKIKHDEFVQSASRGGHEGHHEVMVGGRAGVRDQRGGLCGPVQRRAVQLWKLPIRAARVDRAGGEEGAVHVEEGRPLQQGGAQLRTRTQARRHAGTRARPRTRVPACLHARTHARTRARTHARKHRTHRTAPRARTYVYVHTPRG